MPKSAVHNAVARQWELLKNIPSRGPGITVNVLTERMTELGYKMTKRSIQRDLSELSALFAIQCNDQSKPYGWHWMPERSLEVAGIELTDALSLGLVEAQLRNLVPAPLLRMLEPRFKQAQKKLAASAGNRYAQYKDRVRYVSTGLAFQPPKVEARVLETVQDGLLEQLQIKASYTAFESPAAKELVLHPLALVQQGHLLFLVATAFDYDEPRLYALHRLASAQLTDVASCQPKGFSLDALLADGMMQFSNGEQMALKAAVSNKLACFLTESPIASDQRLVAGKNGKYVLTASVNDSWQLDFWILSQSSEITIQGPKALKNRIRAALTAALAEYQP